MKTSYCFIIYFLTVISSYSQSFQIGIGAGSTIVTGNELYTNELKGYLYEDYFSHDYNYHTFNGFDFTSEYNFGLKARLNLPDFPFSIYSEVSYNSLIGKGVIHLITPVMSSLPPPQRSESKCNLFNASLGIEYELSNKGFIPFISTGVLVCYMGDISIETTDNINYEDEIMEGGIRYGFEIGLGFYYGFYSGFSFGISSKYSMNNLVGKKAAEENINTIKTDLNILYEL
jgi:hypothetical protein